MTLMAFFFFKMKSHREIIFNQLCSHLYSPFKDTSSLYPVPAFFVCSKPLSECTNHNTLDAIKKKLFVLLSYSDIFIPIYYEPKLTQIEKIRFFYFSQNTGKSICKNLLQITTGKDAPKAQHIAFGFYTYRQSCTNITAGRIITLNAYIMQKDSKGNNVGSLRRLVAF